MVKVSISFAESALGDLEALRKWYLSEGVPEVGTRFIVEIFERVEGLTRNPDIGRIVPEFHQPNLRELIHPPFRIIYLREPGKARVVRVWRSERIMELPSESGH